MASIRLEFSMTSPIPGQRFGPADRIRARGGARVTNLGPPTFVVTGVDVQFGAGGAFEPAELSDWGWERCGTPVGRDAVVDVTARCHYRYLDGTGTATTTERVQVIVGQPTPHGSW